eukprot:3924299-Pyramimonas_sp.AAC.1
MGVRFLRDSGYYSDAIIPEQSMIAGLGGAVDFSRCALYNILDRVAQGSPGVTVRPWVDDVSKSGRQIQKSSRTGLASWRDFCKRLL